MHGQIVHGIKHYAIDVSLMTSETYLQYNIVNNTIGRITPFIYFSYIIFALVIILLSMPIIFRFCYFVSHYIVHCVVFVLFFTILLGNPTPDSPPYTTT